MNEPNFLAMFIQEAEETLLKWEKVILSLEKDFQLTSLAELFRLAHNLKGSSKSVGLSKYGHFVHQLEDLITALTQNTIPWSNEALSLLLDGQTALLRWTEGIAHEASFELDVSKIVKKLMEFNNFSTTSSSLLKSDLAKGGPGDIFFADEIDVISTLNDTKNKLNIAPVILNSNQINAERRGTPTEESLRVPLGKIDAMLRTVGELISHHSILVAAVQDGLTSTDIFLEAINLSTRLFQDLNSECLAVRMQPLEGLFQRLERTAMDLARDEGKKIKILIEGDDVELDKFTIEKIKDPLVHMIRNAVDHGIEKQENRAHKFEDAFIQIVGKLTASGVEITLSDNGKGLDPDKILKKALEVGLVNENLKLNKTDIFSLIFEPGFSTAEKVTEVSGRGVGMEVVKRTVDELKGKIEIESEIDKGTVFRLTLPTNISLIEAIIVRISDEKFVIPLYSVQEIVQIDSESVYETQSSGSFLKLRDHVFPLEDLGKYLNTTKLNILPSKLKLHGAALVVQAANNSVAYSVDEIMGLRFLSVRKLQNQFHKLPGVSGCAILHNGVPAPVIDLAEITKIYNKLTVAA